MTWLSWLSNLKWLLVVTCVVLVARLTRLVGKHGEVTSKVLLSLRSSIMLVNGRYRLRFRC